jgi:hypothetical protein
MEKGFCIDGSEEEKEKQEKAVRYHQFSTRRNRAYTIHSYRYALHASKTKQTNNSERFKNQPTILKLPTPLIITRQLDQTP